jgi:hypothetical protein
MVKMINGDCIKTSPTGHLGCKIPLLARMNTSRQLCPAPQAACDAVAASHFEILEKSRQKGLYSRMGQRLVREQAERAWAVYTRKKGSIRQDPVLLTPMIL